MGLVCVQRNSLRSRCGIFQSPSPNSARATSCKKRGVLNWSALQSESDTQRHHTYQPQRNQGDPPGYIDRSIYGEINGVLLQRATCPSFEVVNSLDQTRIVSCGTPGLKLQHPPVSTFHVTLSGDLLALSLLCWTPQLCCHGACQSTGAAAASCRPAPAKYLWSLLHEQVRQGTASPMHGPHLGVADATFDIMQIDGGSPQDRQKGIVKQSPQHPRLMLPVAVLIVASMNVYPCTTRNCPLPLLICPSGHPVC